MTAFRTLAVCLLAVGLGAAARAQDSTKPEPGEQLSIWDKRDFIVPFKLDETSAAQIKELRLYQMQEGTWKWVKTAPPTEHGFDCQTKTDGVFLFGVQGVTHEPRYIPSVEQLRPSLRVIVDTVPPVVTLKAVRQDGTRGESLIGVSWDVSDLTVDLKTLRLDFRLIDNKTNQPVGDWRPLKDVDQRLRWQRLWAEEPRTNLEVRLQVQDHFKRVGEATILVSNLPGSSLPSPFVGEIPKSPSPSVAKPLTGPQTIYRNETSFTLKFRVDRKGPSGLDKVELWWTPAAEGKWALAEQPEGKFVGETDEKTGNEYVLLRFTAPSAGRYGLMLVAVSKSGVRNRETPKGKETPDLWAEVITKPPVIKKFEVKTGKGAEARKLFITWQVDETFLIDEPIQLEYAAKEDSAAWEPIAYNLPNTGKFEWVAPDREPYNFVVRMRVIDRATNEASQVVPGVIVDPIVPVIPFEGIVPNVTTSKPR